jgi:acetyl-CoA synthase
MSKYIATRAMRGANALVTEAEIMLNRALKEKGPDTPVSFPNTAYYLPTILGMTGKAIEKIGDLQPIVKYARDMLHPIPAFSKWTPYLGETLDSGMATLLAAETIEAVRFVYGLQPELPMATSTVPLTISNSARGASNWWTAACLASPPSSGAQNPTKSQSRSCASYSGATSCAS